MLANVGIPLIHLHVGFALVCLAPVVLVEAWIYRRRLSPSWPRGLAASALANLLTTLVGVPIAWLASALVLGIAGTAMAPDSPVLLGVRFAPWLPPLEGLDTAFYRVYPAAVATLLIPSLLVSILLERPVVRRVLRAEREPAGRAVTRANLASYGLLFALSLAWLGYTQVAPVELRLEDARELQGYVRRDAWGSCVADPAVAPHASLANRAWFGPPAYRLEVRGVTDAGERDCLTNAVRAWLERRGVGPLQLEFHTAYDPVRVDERTIRHQSDLLSRELLDGRD